MTIIAFWEFDFMSQKSLNMRQKCSDATQQRMQVIESTLVANRLIRDSSGVSMQPPKNPEQVNANINAILYGDSITASLMQQGS